jgi:hypothetical protein
MFSKSLTKHFKDFRSGFTELHAKLDEDTLLDFAIHRKKKKKKKHEAVKRFSKNNAYSQSGVT